MLKKLSRVLIVCLTLLSFILGISFLGSDNKTSALPEVSTYSTAPVNGDGSENNPFNGDGSENDPFQIQSADELAWLAQRVNVGTADNNAILTSNIDLSGKIWTPIGNSTYPYTWSFNGNGYLIQNMLIDDTITKAEIGLFGKIDNGAKIYDFVLQNTFIQSSQVYIGAVAGAMNGNVTLKNIAVEGGQIIGLSESTAYLGGVVGYIAPSLTTINAYITNTYSNITINSSLSNNDSNIFSGGIYGYKDTTEQNAITNIYNVYFTGQIYSLTVYVNGFGNNQANTIIKNAYYAFYYNSETSFAIVNYSSVKNTTITATTLQNANVINTYFNLIGSSNPYLIGEENWFQNTGEYPVLRGVGNKVVAVRKSNMTSDYSSQYKIYQDLSLESVISTDFLVDEQDDDDITWDTYQLFKKLSNGDKSACANAVENPDRLENVTVTLSTTPGKRQGFYVFEITLIKLLHEQKVYLKDLASYSLGLQDDNLKGNISIYNNAGELFLETTTASRGVSYDVDTWAKLPTYTDTSISIFTTNNTVLTVHAVALNESNQELNYYHSMFLYTPSNYTKSKLSSYEIKAQDMVEGVSTNLVVCLSDVYELSFDTSELFNNNDSLPTNYGGNVYSQPTYTIYISRNSGIIFNKITSGTNAGLLTKADQQSFPVPEATGYVFDGWFAKNITLENVYRFSDDSGNNINENTITTDIQGLFSTYESSVFEEKSYNSANALTLYGNWTLGKNTISYNSILNLYEIDDYETFWNTTPWTEAKAQSILENAVEISDVNMILTLRDKDGNVNSSISNNKGSLTDIDTTSQIGIEENTSGRGYNLTGLLIIGLNSVNENINDISNINVNSLNSTLATFSSSYTIGDNSVWYKYYEYQSAGEFKNLIYHIRGDIMIYAIYDRGPYEITARVNLSVPVAVKESYNGVGSWGISTGFSLTYDIYEIGDDINPITTREITQSNWLVDGDQVYFEIAGLKTGQKIFITSITLNSNSDFIFNETSVDNRILSDDTLTTYHIDINYEDSIWQIPNLIEVNTQALQADKIVYFTMAIRYKGFTLALKASTDETMPSSNLVSEELFAFSGISGTLGVQINSSASIENVKSTSSLVITMNKLERYSPKYSNNVYVVVVTTESGDIFTSNLVLNKNSTYEFELSGFNGSFVDGEKYVVYIIVAQQRYEMQLTEIGETGKIQVSDNFSGNLTFIDNTIIIQNLSYDQLKSLQLTFLITLGYKISKFEINGQTVALTQIKINEEYYYDFSQSNLDLTTIYNNDNVVAVNATVEALKTDYKIEYYKETLSDGTYELADAQVVTGEVTLGETKTINPNSDKYTGFEYISNPNEILTATIMFAENDNMTTFKVYYQRKSYIVAYSGNGNDGGIVPSQQIVKYGHSFIAQENAMTKTGYLFKDWNTNTSGTGITYLPLSSYEMGAGNLTLYANWQAGKYTVIYLSELADTKSSSLWNNIEGYVTSSDQIYATSLVTYEKTYGYVNGTTYSTLPVPKTITDYGYVFAGWWTTSQTGGTQISAGSIVNITQNTTLYARWTKQNITIQYNVNISGVSLTLSFNSKTLYVGNKYSDSDVLTATNSGFPTDTWISAKVLSLKGWSTSPYLSDITNGTASYLTDLSEVPAGQSTINLYAHWEVLSPTIITAENWSSEITFTGSEQNTLQITTSTGTYISNYSSIITYTYQWYKSGVAVSGQTSAVLRLKNVADSGEYTVSVIASHSAWGSSVQSSSQTGNVTINPMSLNLNTIKVGGYITKVYDDTVTVNNVSTSNSSIIKAVAVYDDENVGTDKQITFTISYVGLSNPNNYEIYYEGNLIENTENSTTITFTENSGKITQYDLVLAMGDLSNYANGLTYKVESSNLTLTSQDTSFLGAKGQTLSGYIETASAVAGVYSTLGVGLISYLTLSNSLGEDKTANYNISVTGQYEIVEGVLKTLVISKTAILDKDNQSTQNINTAKFIIKYLTNDISNSGVYNISGIYFNVVNDNNSDEIVISTNQEFNGIVTISAVSFNYAVGEITTIAMPYKWTEAGQTDIIATSISYNFTNIIAGSINNVTVLYENFSTIYYFTRLTLQPSAINSQTVYNTQNGIEITHTPASENGLQFLGWFDSKSASANQIATLWKGYGDINVYAKWNVLSAQVNLFDDETAITNSITKTYDAFSHNINTEITNLSENLVYKYSWKVNSVEKSTANYYSYKNVTSQLITLTIEAKLYYDSVLYQTITTTKTINLTLSKYDFTYDEIIEKIYDGTTSLNAVGYIIVDIVIGTQTEQLKLTGQYTSKFASDDIEMTSMAFSNYLTFSKDNYNLTITSLGKITPRSLNDVNIGDVNDNYKVYDGTKLVVSSSSVVSADLVSGDLLDVTFETSEPNAKIYDASNGEINIVSWSVWDSTRTLDITSSYNLVSLSGTAKITNYEIIMQDIIFANTSLVYNGNQRAIEADFSNVFDNGVVPDDVQITYIWKESGDLTTYTYPVAPSEVGTYLITLTITASETNYSIIGGNTKVAELTITPKSLTINIGTTTFYGQGIKSVTITNAMTNGLVSGQTISGSIKTDSNLPGTYSWTNANLVLELSILDTLSQEKIENYNITVNGSITIIHYYFIVYNANGGLNSMASQQVDYGQEVTLSSNLFVKDGYEFDHWNTQSDDSGITYTDREVVTNLADHNENYTLYAIWIPDNSNYYVYHYLQNLDLTYSSEPTSTEILSSLTENNITFSPEYVEGEISYYNVLTNGGNSVPYYKSFEGFTPIYLENLSVLQGTITPESEGALIIKLYYERNTYTLTWNKNNYDEETRIDVNYLYDEDITQIADPTRDGYDFDGWYTDFNTANQEIVDFSQENKMPASDLMYTANYIAYLNTKYTIEFYEQNVDGTYPTEATSSFAKSATTDYYAFITLTTDIVTGRVTSAVLQVFDDEYKTNQLGTDYALTISYQGFYLSQNADEVLNGIVNGLGTMTLKLYFAREQYSLTKVYNNGQANSVTDYLYMTEISEPSTPAYTGYDFEGWYDNFDETTNTFSDKIIWPINITSNMDIYAKWSPSQDTLYTVNIYLETLAGTYPGVANETKQFISTTNYYAEIVNELFEGKMSNVLAISDETMARVEIETTFDYTGFHINSGLSDLYTYILPNGTGVINLYLERDLYQVTFVYNNGNVDTNISSIKYEQTISRPTDPTYTGYIFAEWYLDSAFTTMVTWPYSVPSNTTMYAKWNPDNTIYTIETYKQDETGNYPAQPQSDEFTGDTDNYIVVEQDAGIWYLREYTDNTKTTLVSEIKSIEITGYTYTQNGEIIEKTITNDGTMVIKLYYTLNSYTFTFELNNGEAQTQQSVFYNSKPIMPANPTYTGYVFAGWFEDIGLTTAFDINSFNMPANNFTIYAKWTPAKDTEYKIEYYLQDLNLNYVLYDTATLANTTNYYVSIENLQVITYETSAKTTVKKTEALKTFIGFSKVANENELLEGTVDRLGTLVLKVYMQRNSYTINFNYNSAQEVNKQIETLYASTVTENIPQRAGYTFVGWYYENTLNTKVDWTINQTLGTMTYVMEAKNIDIFAKWSANSDTKFYVEHYQQNANDDGYTKFETKEYEGITDTTATAIILTYAGFIFDTENASNILSGNINGDNSLILKVYYNRAVYKLIFNGNASDSGTMNDINYKYGQTQTLPANAFIRTGFTFSGWTDVSNGIVVKYSNSSSFTFNKTQDITLYALWQLNEITSAEILLDGNAVLYYGEQTTLQVSASHLANVTWTYEWYFNNVKITNTQQTLVITQLAQSGSYKVVVYAQSTNAQGVQNNLVAKMTESVEINVYARKLVVDFSENTFTYNAQSQEPTYEINYYTSVEENIGLPTLNIIKPTSTYALYQDEVLVENSVNVGTYKIVVSVQENENFEVVGAVEQSYDITRLPWDISSLLNAGEFSKDYAYPANSDPVLQKTLLNEDTNEEVVVTFTREEGESVGLYDLILSNETLLNQNYDILLQADNNGFAIKKVQTGSATLSFVDPTLLTKVYDGQLIDVNSSCFNLDNLSLSLGATLLSATFSINSNSKNVGSYQIVLESATSIEYEQIEMMTQYYFVITKRSVEFVSEPISKIYDGTTNYTDLHMSNVVVEDINNLILNANFTSKDAGNDISLVVSLSGNAKSNYVLDEVFMSLKGNILPRQIKIISSAYEIYEYGSFDEIISYEAYGYNEDTSSYDMAVDMSQISGLLGFDNGNTKFAVGTYNTTIGNVTCSSNYLISEFESGIVEITAKEIQAIADWNKYYDGTTNFENEIELVGVLAEDIVVAQASYVSAEVGELIQINLTLTGADSINYVLQDNVVYGNIEYKYVTATLDYAFDSISAPQHSALAETTLQLIYNKTISESGYVALPSPWATGYQFAGWFDENNNEFTIDTIINSLNWSENESTKTLTAKWTIGNVNLTVGVITYSSTTYQIEQMNSVPLVSGTFTINNVDYLTGGNVKAIEFGSMAQVQAVANSDYEFVGWFKSTSQSASAITTDETFNVNDDLISILMNDNITIYAKFMLKIGTITLYANAPTTSAEISGEYLDWQIDWATSGFNSAMKQFDYNSVVILPTSEQMSRTGYTFVGWADSENGEANYTQIIVSQDTDLYAIWQALTYSATFVASTGADETGLLFADSGHFTNPTDPENTGLWEKVVTFEQPIGVLQDPVRERYDFVGWFDNASYQGDVITSETIYDLTQNQIYYAKWTEKTYTITLTTENISGGQVRVEQSSGVTSIVTNITGSQKTITVQLLSSAVLEIYTDTNKGYELSYQHSYTSGVDFIENISSADSQTYVNIARFNQDLSLNITFKSQLHEIQFTVPNVEYGDISVNVENIIMEELRAESIDDANRISQVITGNQKVVTVYAFTNEQVAVSVTPTLGYELEGLYVNNGDGSFGLISSGVTKFTGFLEDSSAQIVFTESTHTISIKVGKDLTNNENNFGMGSFALSIIDKYGAERVVEENIDNDVNILNIQIKTNETIKITALSNHGFTLSQILTDYDFAKQGEIYSDGSFDLTDIANGVIYFTGFNCGGEINLPFYRETFKVDIKAGYLLNGVYSEITENISNYLETEILADYDELIENVEYYNYEKILTLNAVMNHGYKFVGWYSELLDSSLISTSITYNNYQITDDMTVYAVFELDTFTILYSFTGKGYLSGDSLAQEIKYGQDGQPVTALANAGYEFTYWQIYNQETLNWDIDLINTDITRQEIAITDNMSIRAVFIPSQIEITFNALYITGKDADNNNIFDTMSEDIGSMEIYNSTESGTEFTYQTYTEQVVRVLANAQEGYSVVAWKISDGSQAYYVSNDGIKDITIKGFTQDFTITAIFDSNANVFDIAFVKTTSGDYNFNTSQFVNGGVITIDPSLYLQTQPYKEHVLASVRTKQSFEVVFQILKGYKLITEDNVTKVGIRYDDDSQVYFADNVLVTEIGGEYTYEVTFTMEDFTKGGEIVLFVEEEIFDVTFYKTDSEYRVYGLTINSTFTILDSDYRLPSRVGYIFGGWFSAPSGQGTEYINENGVTIVEWNIEDTTLYAYWTRAFVTYTIQYSPSSSACDGPLGWNVQANELKRAVNTTTFEYYVGISTYFQAPSGLNGYVFSHWAQNGTILTTNQTYIFDIAEDETDFYQTLQIVYKVKYSVSTTVGGTATINGQNSVYLLSGETANLVAVPRIGYDFVGWRIVGTSTILSTDLSYEISYSGQATVYVAVFEGKLVEVIIQSSDYGSVTGWKVNGGDPITENNKLYARLDDTLTFETLPVAGYILTGWEINGNSVGLINYYLIVLSDVTRTNITFKPIFTLIDISYEISFASSGEVKIDNQNIVSGRTFVTNYYGNVIFTFNPTIRYEFKELKLNGLVVNDVYISQSGNVYTVNIPASNLSLTVINRFQIYFSKLLWIDAGVEFSGLGTAQNPYIITSSENFAYMAYLINNNIPVDSDDKIDYASGYYVMMTSVDFIQRFWTPIGTQENPFNGVIRLDYERRNILLDGVYAVTYYDGLFGYITDSAQFLKEQADITTGVIIFSSVGAVLIGIVVLFSLMAYQKRKRLKEQSRVFPTERPMKKHITKKP